MAGEDTKEGDLTWNPNRIHRREKNGGGRGAMEKREGGLTHPLSGGRVGVTGPDPESPPTQRVVGGVSRGPA